MIKMDTGADVSVIPLSMFQSFIGAVQLIENYLAMVIWLFSSSAVG